VRPGFGLCVKAVGNKPEGGGLCGIVCLSGIGADLGWKISSPEGCRDDTSGEEGSDVAPVRFERFGIVGGALIACGRAETSRPSKLSIEVKRACTSDLGPCQLTLPRLVSESEGRRTS
jgi:hypothetical protein